MEEMPNGHSGENKMTHCWLKAQTAHPCLTRYKKHLPRT